MKHLLKFICFIIIVVLMIVSLMACSTPPAVSPYLIQTKVAQALAETQAVSTSNSMPSDTQVVDTPTPIPSDTPSETVTPIPTAKPSSTRTPKPTNAPTATATPSRGTLNSPFKYNEEVSLFSAYLSDVSLIGELDERQSKWTLQVLEVIRGDEANAIIYDANSFNDAPPAGTSWMLVKVKVTLLDGEALTLSAYDIAFISNGILYAGSNWGACCTQDIGYEELDANIALPGTSVEGWVIRPVFLDDTKPLLALNLDDYSPNMGKGLFFELSE